MREGAGLTARDVSGNGNDGTLTNMDANTDWVVGEAGRALDFDGSNDYVNFASSSSTSSSLNITTQDFAIAATVEIGASPVRCVILGRRNLSSNGYRLYYDAPNTRLELQLDDGSGSSFYSSSISIEDGKPHNVAVLADRSGSASFYVDGIAAGSASITSRNGSLSVAEPTVIGRNPFPDQFFKGKVSSVLFWKDALPDGRSITANPNLIYEPHAMFVPGAAGVGGGTIPIFYHHYSMLRAY